jgi:hypothetical protein
MHRSARVVAAPSAGTLRGARSSVAMGEGASHFART